MTGIACEDGLRLLATSRAGHWPLLKTTTQSFTTNSKHGVSYNFISLDSFSHALPTGSSCRQHQESQDVLHTLAFLVLWAEVVLVPELVSWHKCACLSPCLPVCESKGSN